MLNISKQSVHQSRKRQELFDSELKELISQADIIRGGIRVVELRSCTKP